MSSKHFCKKNILLHLFILFSISTVVYFLIPVVLGLSYTSDEYNQNVNINNNIVSESISALNNSNVEDNKTTNFLKIREVNHINTPDEVKAIYMSSWVAGTKKLRSDLVDLVDSTELNAIVIDIKDSTGKIAFSVNDPLLVSYNAVENRIPDIYDFIDLLHSKNIYVIGRIAVFQDPQFVKNHPEEAVKKSSDKTLIWKDRNGISWIDAGSQKAWEYTNALAKESYEIGFDEINFDYIRFPSDGNMEDIYYPISEGKIKSEILKSFYEYINQNLKPQGVVISADLFGMTTTNTDDLGIGQILEDALRNFDFVGPMVYPSHFPPNWNGYPKPANKPYEVIHFSMQSAVKKAESIGEPIQKLRPWLQDFNLGATYTAPMVRAQIDATYDAGLNSWMLWDAGNTYTKDALEIAQ